MQQSEVSLIFRRLAKAIPKPETELNYDNPFQLLVAVTLSAQSTDVSVNKATDSLFRIVKTPEDILDLGVDGLLPYIKTIGLFNNKARHIVAACSQLVEKHGGHVPDNRADLEALPGVGRKTANVILNTAFGHPTIAVDTHIFRVSNRTGIAPGKNVLKVENGLLQVVPKRYLKDAHHLLILHGRYTCKAQKPLCYDCPIADLCAFESKTTLKS
ncbi:MAG: endonuclease III [marine bacterium B5-7]|nr:MAG: endonuclease III [marine bacterium B5-7]